MDQQTLSTGLNLDIGIHTEPMEEETLSHALLSGRLSVTCDLMKYVVN